MSHKTESNVVVKTLSHFPLWQWPLETKIEASSFDRASCDGEIPSEGWSEIHEAYHRFTGKRMESYCYLDSGCYLITGDSGVGKQYVVKSHPHFAGSLIKRLRKWCHVTTPDIKLTDDQWGEIGSIIGKYQNAKISVDFTDCLDWIDGDFGDGGSCFMQTTGCRHWVLEYLMEAGVHAMRVYDENGAGKARCLIAPHPTDDDTAIVWNAYGIPILRFARMLSLLTGTQYRQIQLRNNGEAYGAVYCNNGSGYVVAGDVSAYTENGSTRIDLQIDAEKPVCPNCGRDVGDDDDYSLVCDDTRCTGCANYCDECDEYTSDDLVTVHDNYGNPSGVCESCRDDNYHACPCCNEYVAD